MFGLAVVGPRLPVLLVLDVDGRGGLVKFGAITAPSGQLLGHLVKHTLQGDYDFHGFGSLPGKGFPTGLLLLLYESLGKWPATARVFTHGFPQLAWRAVGIGSGRRLRPLAGMCRTSSRPMRGERIVVRLDIRAAKSG